MTYQRIMRTRVNDIFLLKLGYLIGFSPWEKDILRSSMAMVNEGSLKSVTKVTKT
jgi:hypothetical protein